MIVTLCIAAIDPRLLDRALLAAAALADEGDALGVGSLIAQGADVPAAILLRGEHRLVPRANEPSARDVYLSAQTYVGGAVLDGERWLLIQTCRQNRVLLRGDVLRYEGRRAALRHRSNVVGAFLGALTDAGVDLRTIPVRTFESEEPRRPWWAVHSLPLAFLGQQVLAEDGGLRLSAPIMGHLGSGWVSAARQGPGEVLLIGEEDADDDVGGGFLSGSRG